MRLLLAAAFVITQTSAVCAQTETLAVQSFNSVGANPAALTAPPLAFWGATGVALNDQLYFIGGQSSRGMDAVQRFDPNTGRWDILPSLPANYAGGSAVAFGGKILFGGGEKFIPGIRPQPSTDLLIYDPRTAAWSSGPSSTLPRGNHTLLTSYDARLFISGGMKKARYTIESLSHGRWSEAGRIPWQINPNPIATVGSKIYFLENVMLQMTPGVDPVTPFYSYDLATGEWSTLQPMPSQRLNATGAALDGKVYVVGGSDNSASPYASVDIYDPDSDTWQMGTQMPTPRGAASAIAFRGKLYVAGGSQGGAAGISVLEAYDPATLKWRTSGPPARNRPREQKPLARMQLGRLAGGGALLPNGHVLFMGGYDTSGRASPFVADYEPLRAAWFGRFPMRHPRFGFGLVTLDDGRMLAVGGQTGVVGHTFRADILNAVDIYDPRAGKWTEAAPMSAARLHPAVVKLKDGRVLVAGGLSGLSAPSKGVFSAEIYNPATNRWTPTPSLVFPSASLGGGLLPDGRVLLVGHGGDGNRESDPAVYYDPASNAWNPAASLMPPRDNPATAVLPDGRIMVAGGCIDLHHVNTTSLFDPRTGLWESGGSLRQGRIGHALVVVGGRVAAIGGFDPYATDYAPLTSVEVFDPQTRSWKVGPGLIKARAQAVAVALDDRHVLVAGGGKDPLDGETNNYVEQTSEILDLGIPESAAIAEQVPSPMDPSATAKSPAPAAHFTAKASRRPHDYAVVIGIDHYERLPSADFAENDARDATAMFVSLGVPEENIVTLEGPRASMTEVVKYVEGWLPQQVAPDSRVYFYYSGHGGPDVLDGSSYMMPWDADASYVKTTAVSLDRLYAALGSLPAKEVIAMIDACFSGAGGRSVLAPGARPLVALRASNPSIGKVSVLTASASSEIAGSLSQEQHGLFTYYVLRGLSGEADAVGSGHVTLLQLHAYVRRHVIFDARGEGHEQTPMLVTQQPDLRLY